MNRLLATDSPALAAAIVDGRETLLRLGGVLGLFGSVPAEWLARQGERRLAESGLDAAAIEQLIDERLAARKNRDFARADRIRDELAEKGVQLLDSPQGTTWKMK